MDSNVVHLNKPHVTEDMIEWLASQLNEEAQPYQLDDDLRQGIIDTDDSVRGKARFYAEHLYLQNHFAVEQETCPLAVVDEQYGLVYAAALHRELGMVVQHWFLDDDQDMDEKS